MHFPSSRRRPFRPASRAGCRRLRRPGSRVRGREFRALRALEARPQVCEARAAYPAKRDDWGAVVEQLLNVGHLAFHPSVICTIGTMPNALIAELPLPKVRGRIVTNADMSVPGFPGVWALGDCAAVPNMRDGKASPPTAQFADRQARLLARKYRGKPARSDHAAVLVQAHWAVVHDRAQQGGRRNVRSQDFWFRCLGCYGAAYTSSKFRRSHAKPGCSSNGTGRCFSRRMCLTSATGARAAARPSCVRRSIARRTGERRGLPATKTQARSS